MSPEHPNPSWHPSWLSSSTAIKSHATAPYDGYANGYAAAMPMGPGLVPLVEAHHMPPMAVAPGPSFVADHGFLRP